MQIIKGKTMPKALRVVIYGIHGSAKTTLASKLRNALFLDYENGTHGIAVDKVYSADLPRSYTKVKGLLVELKKDHQGYETLVIDTGDELEKALDQTYSQEKGIESIFSTNDYGRTVADHNAQIGSILDKVNDLVESGMNVVWVCHEQKRSIQPLEGAKIPSDHSELKMSKGASKLLMQNVDWAIFCARKTFHVDGDKHTGEKAHMEGGKLWTFHSPTNDWDAKHRACIDVADDMSMDKLQQSMQDIIDKSIQQGSSASVAVTTKTPKVSAEAEAEAKKALAKKREEKARAEEPKPESPKESLPKAVSDFLQLVKQYEVDNKKLREYAASKLNDRYGIDFATLDVKKWPEEALLWLCRGMDKIAAKLK